MADDKRADEPEESAEPKGTSDAAEETQPGDGDSKETARARRLANLGGGGNAHVLKHRAAKQARESTVLTREELAAMLSRVLRDSRTKAPYFAQNARVLSDIMGYSKGPPAIDPSLPTGDLQAFIEELQPDDPDDSPDSPESEAGDPPKPDPEIDKY